MFEVTEHLGEVLSGAELRGTIWRVERRIGDYGLNEVHGEMIGEVDDSRLRPPFSVLPTLCRVFDCVDLALDVAPHKPPRLILTPAPGDPPPDLLERPASKVLAEQAKYDSYRQQLASGTLPASIRKAFPKLIARLEEELRANRP